MGEQVLKVQEKKCGHPFERVSVEGFWLKYFWNYGLYNPYIVDINEYVQFAKVPRFYYREYKEIRHSRNEW